MSGCYSPGARLDASVPGGRVRADGPEAIAGVLGGWWGTPGVLTEWSPDDHPEGIALTFERAWEVDDGEEIWRQRHYMRTEDGLISRHWIYSARPKLVGGIPADLPGQPDAGLFAELGEIVEMGPLEQSGGNTGVPIERIVLADEQVLIAKRVEPLGDWIMRITDDRGRAARLWLSGFLDRMPASVDTAIAAVEPDGDGWWVVMRDVSDSLLGAEGSISRDENRHILAAAAEMYAAYWNAGDHPDLCSLQDRIGFSSPANGLRELREPDLPPKQFEMAWEAFAEAADRDVAEQVLAILDDPSILATELNALDTTLLHGDFRDENLGLTPDGIVLLDWGFATTGPPAVDYAWYLMHGAWRIEATHDQLLDDFRDTLGERHDPRALELGLIFGLVSYGWILGHSAAIHPDPTEREWALEELGWWVPRVRRALETWSPG